MKTFEECWEKAVTEIEESNQKSSTEDCRFINKEGKSVKIKLLHLDEGTFIPVYAMRRALGVSAIAQSIIRKGISMKKTGNDARHGRYVLDAENAVRFLARYGEENPEFKEFFKDNIFAQLSDFGG